MREIQTAENKTLKLTNVVSRRIQPEEFNNMQIVLTQMHNFIKSNGAQPLGPLVQCIKLPAGPNPQPCLLYTSPSPRDRSVSRMPSSA